MTLWHRFMHLIGWNRGFVVSTTHRGVIWIGLTGKHPAGVMPADKEFGT